MKTKRITGLTLAFGLLITGNTVFAQEVKSGDAIPDGAVVYALPMTTLHIQVEAEREVFTAGPYAKFARTYLGLDARQEDQVQYRITQLQVRPYLEADPAHSFMVNLTGLRNAVANFSQFHAQGLIVLSDSHLGREEKSRFGVQARTVFTDKGMSSNLTQEQITLYRAEQSASGINRVAVPQSQTVEKSVERRAEEAAELIFKLRTKRVEIITGDTDATFSGAALGDAVKEMARLEEEYLSLFLGKSAYSTQTMQFEVLPSATQARQTYIAFRLSDTEGLMPASNLSGRPIVLELKADTGQPQPSVPPDAGKSAVKLFYRKPVAMQLLLSDGQELLAQSRVLIYQLGQILSFPLNVSTGR
ncbi:MAG: DUF4831 family protein [Bacteroidales bacterium]|nr:DUF4831 family protein [Bacteroidales bacterium]MCL2738475.1 DUF4831 family protein [Bacteroidales bacterium]